MVKMYYVVAFRVYDPEVDFLQGDVRVFRRPTELPFPSPIGTVLHVNAAWDACGFYSVEAHIHLQQEDCRGIPGGELYMYLFPQDKTKHVKILDKEAYPQYFGFTCEKKFNEEASALISNGWEEMDSNGSYIPGFLF